MSARWAVMAGRKADVGGFTVGTNDIKGGFAGGTLGYNWQAAGSPFVFGIEADGAWSDIKFAETNLGVTFEDRIRSFGSVTGRLGYAVDAALFYFKGGYAWANNRLSATDNVVGTFFSESRFHSGWTVGGGLEYGFAPNWSVGIEYDHMFMQDRFITFTNNGTLAPAGTAYASDRIHQDVDLITVRVNYRWGGAVIARY